MIDNIVSYGIDYVRFKCESEDDFLYIANSLEYVPVMRTSFHGGTFVDISGKMLETIRTVESVPDMVADMCQLVKLSRLDVYIDVVGDILPECKTPGTEIRNDGKTETIYSHKLTSRGNVPVFGRAYDAQAAKHYDFPVTRFEIEFKNPLVVTMCNPDEGWAVNPIDVALWHIMDIYGANITIQGRTAIEFNPPKRRLAPDRERFYSKYGKGILHDIETWGTEQFLQFLFTVVRLDDKGVTSETD